MRKEIEEIRQALISIDALDDEARAALVTLEIPVHRALHIGVRVTGRHVEHTFKLTGAGREWSETQGNGRDNNRPSSVHDPHSWLDERLQDKLQCSRAWRPAPS